MKLRWRLARLALAPLGSLMFKLQVTGRDKLVAGPQIIACNHVSNVDPISVGLASPYEVHFLAKQELFAASKAFAWLIRTFNAWPVRRGAHDAAAVRRCSWLLQRRQNVVLFPEGTRSRTGEVGRFRPGIGLLSITNRVPVVPLYLGGVNRSLISYLVDRDFVRKGYRRKPECNLGIHASFGDPVFPAGYPASKQGYSELTLAVEEQVRKMARESGDLPTGPGSK